MKKKLALSIAAAAMIGTLAVGGTLAWFTDVETATNIVTVGEVDIKLSETGEGTVTEDGSGLGYVVMPGKTYDKAVTIENVGNAAYVRAIITVSGSEKIANGLLNGDTDAISFYLSEKKQNWTGWTRKGTDSVSYTIEYSTKEGDKVNNVFEEGVDTPWTLFTGFNIPSSWGNQYENEEFNINVEVQAIQADNTEKLNDVWVEFDKVTDPDASKTADETGSVTAQ